MAVFPDVRNRDDITLFDHPPGEPFPGLDFTLGRKTWIEAVAGEEKRLVWVKIDQIEEDRINAQIKGKFGDQFLKLFFLAPDRVRIDWGEIEAEEL